MQRHLLLTGTTLILVGLVLGTILDWFANPAIASDAHVAGIQHGMLLMILGMSWRYTDLGKLELPCAYLNIIGLIGIWAAFLAGAVLGDPYPSASKVTYSMFVVSSTLLILGFGVFLYGLFTGTGAYQAEAMPDRGHQTR